LAAIQHELLGFSPQQRVLIPNGVDLTRFKPIAGARLALRQELALQSDALVVGAVGRYHPQKDFEGLLRAAAVILQRGLDVHLVIVGRGATQGNRSLTSLASDLGIRERVHLLGERHEVQLVVAGFDLFASSSVNEGFCNVLVEAMACGVPCVATDVGAAREVLQGLGCVVPPGDPAALGRAIADTLSLSTQERLSLGARERGCVRTRYCLSSMVDRYAELYLEVLQPRLARSRESVCKAAA